MYRTPCPIKGVLRIQQYLQNERYALWEVIEFGDSYEAPQEVTDTGSASKGSTKKKGRTVAVTTEDMQKRRNDVKVRTTLLLALPDEHQLRFSKYKTAQELWAAILKTFGGNEATKKTKKNQLKQQYGNFKAEGKETLKQTFNRLQAIVSHLEFMDVEIELDDLNQKLLTSLSPEWLMYTIVWRNRSDLDTMSLDDLYNHLKVYKPEVQKKSNSQNMAFISLAKNSSGNGEVNTAIPTASTQVFLASANVVAKKTGKKISIQGTDVAGFDKSKVECFNCHKMGHFARECRAPRSQDRGRRENFKQCSKVEESAPKALMAIDGEAPTEFALIAKSSSDNEFCSSPPPAQVYSPPKKDMSWRGLPKFAKDTITDYSRPSPSIESNSSDLQNSDSSVSENGESSKSIMSKPMIKFVKAADSPTVIKTNKDETVRKPSVKYAEMYRKTSKSSNVGVNQRNWNNLKSQQLGENFLMKNKACFKCGHFDHLAYDCGVWVDQGKPWAKNNYTHKSRSSRTVFHKIDRTPAPVNIPHMNVAQSKRTYFSKSAHSYVSRPIQRKSAVKIQFRVPRVSTGNTKFPTVNKNFPTGNSKLSTTDLGNKGKAIKASACWIWKPRQNSTDKGRDFKLRDDTNLLLRTPRQHNMYSIDLNNIVPHKDLTCLVAKASADESELWHMRLGHLNFKTMNKLVRHNLVRGLPSKCFENDNTCAACLKGKQHKASCKTKVVHSVTKPLHTLHMDLFGPTSISSLNHKWYCLVVTDDFSMFTWTFFLKTKDETSGILRNFITKIENLKDLKNGVAERRNRTLIEATRTILADAILPATFWAEAVNTACYVQNRVLVHKSQNNTPYELFNGRTPAIRFLKPFGCHVMILNTLDNLGKFDAKGDEVVSTGTTSTNFSGTKEAASQDVKKDSGNSNPTATSTNPPADQMETLTVKTLIPTVSSHVPTVCLDDSPQLSSDTKLISKRVTSQDDTPSLDNILTLLNRFEDILGVSTNTGDTNGVEADLSNMETNISASPTPTFRIHHMRNPDLLQFCLFSCFLSQEEPKKIFDALKDPSWEEAMQEELLQFKIHNDPKFQARVYKVEKAMHGLHQAPRAWYGTLSKYLLTNDFQREFEALMHEEFQMSAMGELNFFLGLQVLQKKDDIFLSQDKYVGDILKKFGYSDVRSANTPMDKENPWGKDGTSKDVGLHLYRSMIRSLMYLTASRPDIMFAVCACARHQVTPKEYSDYGGATQDMKSTTRGCQFWGRRLISWQCKKQTIMATLITKVEYVAAASGCG
nr:hypothetical protein [Tanacetum cinerariifolium]